MKIAIFGLGYVGSVSAACLASAGHDVIGVDVDQHKLALIRQGRSPVTEPGLDELLAAGLASGRLRVTEDTADAVQHSDVALVCVGTPSRRNGSIEMAFLESVMEELGRAIAARSTYYVVGVRSTLVPGALEGRLIPLLERASDKRVGVDVGVCVNPEFLREGSAIADFGKPPFTIIGETDRHGGDVLQAIYDHLHAPVHRVRPDEASMVKYASNVFHAMKVAFANEVGAVSQHLGIDGRQVMRIFCEDRELNISPRYLRPGFGFGGSCLPKDLRAMVYAAKEMDLVTPLLGSVIASNDAHIQRVVDAVLDTGKRRVALLGLSFKVGSDDLRESPFVRLAEAMIGKGVTVCICDPDVSLGNLFGRNRAYIDERLPHVAQLLAEDWEDVVRGADVVIVGKHLPGLERLPQVLRADQTVVDLVGLEISGHVLRPWAATSPGASHPQREPLGVTTTGA
jgi:GDP-mannose 6-dehydrogenase